MSLLEAQFACFDDNAITSTSNGSTGRLEKVAYPANAPLLDAKNFIKVRGAECTGSGHFFFQTEALQGRFISWRIVGHAVALKEWSFHSSLSDNVVRLEFQSPVAPNGVFVSETWDANAVLVSVVTQAGCIHRYTYSLPSTPSSSFLSTSCRQSDKDRHDITNSLSPSETVTNALWINEYNLVVTSDTGRLFGINFGVPPISSTLSQIQEFAFTETSSAKRVWSSFLWGSSDDTSSSSSTSRIIAMSCFPLQTPFNDDESGFVHAQPSDSDDLCVLTLSSDLVLKAYSYTHQCCLGRQPLHQTLSSSGSDFFMDEFTTVSVGQMEALPPTSSDNIRLLLHLNTSHPLVSRQIFLLKGEVDPSSMLSTSSAMQVNVARVLGVSPSTDERLKLVDFQVHDKNLYSIWQTPSGTDFIFFHPSVLSRTGPRIVEATLVSDMRHRMQQEAQHDLELALDIGEDAMSSIDDYFCRRILLPNRFSRKELYLALHDYESSLYNSHLDSFFQRSHVDDAQVKDILQTIVQEQTNHAMKALGQKVHPHEKQQLHIRTYQDLLHRLHHYWSKESAPLGIVAHPSAPYVAIIRYNRQSLVSNRLQLQSSMDTDEVVALHTEVLPRMDAIQSTPLRLLVTRRFAELSSDDKSESTLASALHCIHLSLQTSDKDATKSMLALYQSIGQADDETQVKTLSSIIDNTSASSIETPPSKAQVSSMHIGREMAQWLSELTKQEVEAGSRHALRCLLLMAQIVEMKPTYLPSILQIENNLLPRAVKSYERWQVASALASSSLLDDFLLELSADENITSYPSLVQRAIQELVSCGTTLVTYLEKQQSHVFLRQLASLHAPTQGAYRQWIAECLSRQGKVLSSKSKPSKSDKDRADWCFTQAISNYRVALLSSSDHSCLDHALSLLKETLPTSFHPSFLQLLWELSAHFDADEGVWLNLFKYSVEADRLEDAHLALCHILRLDDSERMWKTGKEACHYLVKEACSRSYQKFVCETKWGELEDEVELQLRWQAAHATLVDKGLVSDTGVRHFYLLQAFYSSRGATKNAATAMYSLAYRLSTTQQLAMEGVQKSLYVQANALLRCKEMLQQLPKTARGIEEVIAPSVDHVIVVSMDDMEKEVSVLKGKIRLLQLGFQEKLVLVAVGPEEVVSLLAQVAFKCTIVSGSDERRQKESVKAVELAVDITRKHQLDFGRLTHPLALACMSYVQETGTKGLSWSLLERYLSSVDDVKQCIIAAETILSYPTFKIELPDFVYEPLIAKDSGHPSKLLQMYLSNGMVLQALDVCDRMVPDSMNRKDLPYLPYDLLDVTLNAAEEALASRRAASSDSERRLQDGVSKVRSKLTAYFEFILAMEEANASDGMALVE